MRVWLINYREILTTPTMNAITLITTLLSKPIPKMIIVAICLITISTSSILFVTDRGNIISYSKEKINGWKNPTYQEMITFIQEDITNYKPFQQNVYECKQFAIDLIRNARFNGYRAGYVTLYNPEGFDHAIVSFQTSDKGIYFVEPQNDHIITYDEMNEMIANNEYQIISSTDISTFQKMPLSGIMISWYMII